MIANLTKSNSSEGFNQIVDFLNESSIKYALTVNPNIYVSCIKQFWTTVAVKKVNDVTRLQALVDKKKVVVTKATIRDALRLHDGEGVECLPNEEIFAELARMSYEKPSTKLTFHKVAKGDVDEVHGEDVNAAGVELKGLLVAQALEITKLKSRVKKLERRNKAFKLKRLKKVGSAQRIDTSDDTVTDDVSKQGGIIENINADEDVVQEDAKDVAINAKDNQDADKDKKLKPIELQEVVDVVTIAKIITEVVTAASITINAVDVPIPAATTVAAPTLTVAPSKRRKGVVVKDPEESTTTSTIIHSEAKSKDKELNRTIDWDEVIDYVHKKAKEDNTMKRYQAVKRKPQTEAQARKNMMIYLKNVPGLKMDYIKEKAAKKQKLDKEVEELKRHLLIVPNNEDDVYTEATPLALKVLVVDYEIYNQNSKPYYKIKRADARYTGSSLEKSKKCLWSSKSQELEAVGILWCADNYIYNNIVDIASKKEISTHKVHSGSDAK
nr:hypothetical protein [Tanacetum cinerariifolium]